MAKKKNKKIQGWK